MTRRLPGYLLFGLLILSFAVATITFSAYSAEPQSFAEGAGEGSPEPTLAPSLVVVPNGEDPCVHPAVLNGGCVCLEHDGVMTFCAVVYALPTRPEANTPTPVPTATATSTPAPTATPDPSLVQVNRLFRAGLMTALGITEAQAQAIITYRSACVAGVQPYFDWAGVGIPGAGLCARGIKDSADLTALGMESLASRVRYR